VIKGLKPYYNGAEMAKFNVRIYYFFFKCICKISNVLQNYTCFT